MKFVSFPLLGLQTRQEKAYKFNLGVYKTVKEQAAERGVRHLPKFAYETALKSFENLESLSGSFDKIQNFHGLLDDQICFDAIDGDYMDLVGKSKLKDLKPLRFIGCTAYIEHCGYLLLELNQPKALKDYEAERLVKKIK